MFFFSFFFFQVKSWLRQGVMWHWQTIYTYAITTLIPIPCHNIYLWYSCITVSCSPKSSPGLATSLVFMTNKPKSTPHLNLHSIRSYSICVDTKLMIFKPPSSLKFHLHCWSQAKTIVAPNCNFLLQFHIFCGRINCVELPHICSENQTRLPGSASYAVFDQRL